MAVGSLSRIIDKNFLSTLFSGQAPSSRRTSSDISSSVDAVVKSTSLLRDGLRNGARIFGAAVQNLNVATSFLLSTKTTLEQLSEVVDKVINVAQTASKSSVGVSQRANLDAEYRRLGSEFKRIIGEATGRDISELSEEDLKGVLVSIGLDPESSESVAGIFSQFEFSEDDKLGSDRAQAQRPVPYAKETRFVAEGTLQAPVTLPSSLDVGFLGVGDFNNDGTPDIVNASTTGAGTEIRFGNGDGTFTSAATLDASSGLAEFAIGDIDNDGNLDYAAPIAANRVGISLGNGDGTFSPRTTITGLTFAGNAELQDLNQDGNLDLLVGVLPAGGSTEIRYYLGNGDGTFQAQRTIASSTSKPNALSFADYDSDGIIDIAALNTGGAVIDIFSGNGDGTFATSTTFATGTSATLYGLSIESNDVNLDGKVDLITTGGSDATVNIYLGNGDGTFGARRSYALAGATVSRGLAVGDVTGDGIADIVAGSSTAVSAAGEGKVTLFRGNGDGTFSSYLTIATDGDSVNQVKITDFNGDGVSDFGYSVGLTAGLGVVYSDSIETTNRRPKTFASLFDSTRSLNSRSEAFGLLADAKAVKAELENNLSAVNEGLSLIESNINVSRALGLKLLDMSDNVSSATDADSLARELASTIRSTPGSSNFQTENLDPVIAAAILNSSSSG